MIDITRWESTTTQRRAAALSAAAVVLFSLALTPFAGQALPASYTVVAMILGAAIAANATTAFLLYSQYRSTRSPAVAALALGYAYAAGVMAPYLLTYPGMLAPGVPFGQTEMTSAWLWIAWHIGFMALLLAYAGARARLERPGTERLAGKLVRTAYRITLPVYALLLAAALYLPNLPAINVGGHWTPIFAFAIAPTLLALAIGSLVVLIRATRLRSALDLWLSVAMVVTICDVYLTLIGNGRFTVGWYVARGEILIASFAVLAIFVYQIDRMYGLLARTASHLDEQAHIDGLTGIANRRRFDEYAARVVATAQRRNAHLAALICDIDLFKQYNDGFGHLAGDDCLRHVAHIIRSQVPRPGDLVARYGGEEFVVVLVDTDIIGAQTVAERIRKAVEDARIPHAPSTHRPYVTISIGASDLGSGRDSLAGIIGAADAALYEAKRLGRNRVEVATETTAAVGS
jgi:diguanylate cyclase (GGDEF)-like protein